MQMLRFGKGKKPLIHTLATAAAGIFNGGIHFTPNRILSNTMRNQPHGRRKQDRSFV